MNDIVVHAFEVILVSFIVSGTVTTIYNVVTFRARSDSVARRERARLASSAGPDVPR